MLLLLMMLADEKDKDRIVYLYETFRQDMLNFTAYTLKNKYYGTCHDVCHDTEDIVSDTFVKLITNIHMIDFKRSEHEIRGYVMKVLSHEIYDHFVPKRSVELSETFDVEPISDEDMFEEIANIEENEIVIRAISMLEEPHRVVLGLHYVEKMSISDISQLLGKPYTTIHSRLMTAKGHLAKILKEKGVTVDE